LYFKLFTEKFPEKFSYDSTVKELCDSFNEITEQDPRGSLIWLIGEFSERIEKSIDILNELSESFLAEPQFVQLQILTASVKVFLKQPDAADQLITRVLELASEKNDNPDVRDRGYIYWRMLSTDTEMAKRVVLSERPIINEETVAFEPALLDNLIHNISMVSSVFHKNAESLIPKVVVAVAKRGPEEEEEEMSPSTTTDAAEAKDDGKKKDEKKDEAKSKYDDKDKKADQKDVPKDKKKIDIKPPGTKSIQAPVKDKEPVNKGGDLLDLLDVAPSKSEVKPEPPKIQSSGGGDLLDIFDTVLSPSKGTDNVISQQNLFSQPETLPTIFQNVVQVETATPVPYEVLLKENTPGANGKSGVKLEGAFLRENQKIILGLKITNFTNSPLTDFDAQIKPNYFGLKIESFPPLSIAPNLPTEIKVLVTNKGQSDNVAPPTPLTLTVGLKNSVDVFYLNIPLMFHVLLDQGGEMKQEEFKKLWKDIPNTNELMFEITTLNPGMRSLDAIKKAFRKNNIFYLAGRNSQAGNQIMYFTSRSVDGTWVLSEVTLPSAKSANGSSISCRCLIQSLIPLFLQCSSFILNY